MRSRLLAFVLVACGLAALLFYSRWGEEPRRVSGFIEADEIRLGSRVGGRVQKVLAEEGDHTTPGQVLVVLEPFDLLERRAEAQANLRAAKEEFQRLADGFREEEIEQARAQRDQIAARLALLEEGPTQQSIKAAEARHQAAQAESRLAEQNYQRTLQLFRKGATTQEEMDRIREQQNAAQATLIVRQQEMEELKENTPRPQEVLQAKAQLEEAGQRLMLRERGFRKEEIAQAKAAFDQAAAALAVIERQIEELEIRSPVAGVIEASDLQPGDLVTAGAPVVSMIDADNLWIRAYVPQKRLHVTTGMLVPVAVDAFPGQTFQGEITFISRQAEFTPSNVQTKEERLKQVFRIKVSLREGLDRLRPGMTGDVLLEEARMP